MNQRYWLECAMTAQAAMRRADDPCVKMFWAGLALQFLTAGGFRVTA